MYSTSKDTEAEDQDAKEFPILCGTCLGPNPFTRQPFGKACKICERPFTIFRWCPGQGARFKKTEICKTCAKIKNVCQTCILDLQYGLPVQVRDTVLESDEKVELPSQDANKGFAIEKIEKELDAGGSLPYDKVQSSGLLKRLARKAPYYPRNRPHICSFFAKGECNRGSQCPYRHEMPTTGELAHQNITDRYHGHNDPVAKKMMRRTDANLIGSDDKEPDNGPPAPPEDVSITTVWVGGLDMAATEEEVREKFYKYGTISSIKVVPSRGCAFVTFGIRQAAEQAVSETYNSLSIHGLRLRVAWGKTAGDSAPQAGIRRPPPGLQPPPPPGMGAPTAAQYPSMNPNNITVQLQR